MTRSINDEAEELAAPVDSENPFNCLPVDLLKKILGLDNCRGFSESILESVPTIEESRQLMSTCKLFSSLIQEGRILRWDFDGAEDAARFVSFISSNHMSCWKNIWLKERNQNLPDLQVVLSALLPFASGCESLNIFSNTYRETTEDPFRWNKLLAVLSKCRSLKEASIVGFRGGATSNLFDPANPLYALTTLKLSNIGISSSNLQRMLLAMPKLQDLNLSFTELDRPNTFVLESATLRKLMWWDLSRLLWSQQDQSAASNDRFIIKSSSLKTLYLYSDRLISLCTQSLEELSFSNTVRLDAAAPMCLLREFCTRDAASWTQSLDILEASCNVEKMTIRTWQEERHPPCLSIGRLFENIRELCFGFDAWLPLCSATLGTALEREGIPCFPGLQQLELDLGSWRTTITQESLAKLRTTVAACGKGLRQVTLYLRNKEGRIEDVFATIQALGEEHPAIWFVLEDQSRAFAKMQRLLAVKSTRVIRY